MLNGLAKQSQSTYGTGQRHYLRFAEAYGLGATDILPVTPTVMLAFIAWLFTKNNNLAVATAKSYLTHVKQLCIILGYDTKAFECPRVKYALKGYGRYRGTGTKRPKRLPITIPLLGIFISHLDEDTHDHVLVKAALCVGVYGLFRSGELTTKPQSDPENVLRRSDTKWSSNDVTIRLRSSKTDPFRHGVDVVLVRNDSPTCPFNALRATWDRAPSSSPFAPLFQCMDGNPLRYAQLHQAIKHLAQRAGLDPKAFAGHSMRIGGATSLAQLGYPAHFIKQLGRWESLSFQLYTRLTETVRSDISMALGGFRTPDHAHHNSYFGGMEPSKAYSSSVDDFFVHFASHRQDG